MNIATEDRRIVGAAYRGRRQIGGLDHDAFDAALRTYLRRYPGVSRTDALADVTWILAHEQAVWLSGASRIGVEV